MWCYRLCYGAIMVGDADVMMVGVVAVVGSVWAGCCADVGWVLIALRVAMQSYTTFQDSLNLRAAASWLKRFISAGILCPTLTPKLQFTL